jgi:ketosteroid isomerase-like protein
MSQENVEIVKAVFAAWKERDPETALKHIDPNVEFDFTETAFVGQEADPESGTEGLQSTVAAWLEAWESLEYFPQNFIDVGDHVIALLRIVAQHRESAVPVERNMAVVYTLRSGLVVGIRGYDTLAAAAGAVGV